MTSEEWYSGGERLATAGVNVFYRHEGKGEALVCIHGFPTSSWDFAPLWDRLTDRFNVLAHDLVGLGIRLLKNYWPERWRISRM